MKKTHYTAPQTRVEEIRTECMLANSTVNLNTEGQGLDYHQTLVRDGSSGDGGFWD